MPETVWIPLIFAGAAGFFLMLDLSLGMVTLFGPFFPLYRDRNPRAFWAVEIPYIVVIIGFFGLAAFGYWKDVVVPYFR